MTITGLLWNISDNILFLLLNMWFRRRLLEIFRFFFRKEWASWWTLLSLNCFYFLNLKRSVRFLLRLFFIVDIVAGCIIISWYLFILITLNIFWYWRCEKTVFIVKYLVTISFLKKLLLRFWCFNRDWLILKRFKCDLF